MAWRRDLEKAAVSVSGGGGSSGSEQPGRLRQAVRPQESWIASVAWQQALGGKSTSCQPASRSLADALRQGGASGAGTRALRSRETLQIATRPPAKQNTPIVLAFPLRRTSPHGHPAGRTQGSTAPAECAIASTAIGAWIDARGGTHYAGLSSHLGCPGGPHCLAAGAAHGHRRHRRGGEGGGPRTEGGQQVRGDFSGDGLLGPEDD